MAKRCFDILTATLLGLFCLPFLLLAILLILIEDGRPVLLMQWRLGRGFKPFRICKLRTIKRHGSRAPVSLGEAACLTHTGRWLCKFKIDQLPQLWNVLRGEMSMVGPRPVIPAMALEFVEAYTQLLSARPGLTDPATVKYCRQTELPAQSLFPLFYFKSVIVPDKLRLSLGYQRQAAVGRDLLLLTATAWAILGPLLQPLHKLATACLRFAGAAAAILPRMDWREVLQPVYLPQSAAQPSSFSSRRRQELWADSPRARSSLWHQV